MEMLELACLHDNVNFLFRHKLFHISSLIRYCTVLKGLVGAVLYPATAK